MFVPMSVYHCISALSLTARARYILPGRSLLRLLFISSRVAPLCHIATMDDGTMELDFLDQIVTFHEPLDLGNFRHVPGWNGKCIGDCIATISDKVLRVVAFQAAECIGEVQEWVNDAVKQIKHSGAHVGIFAERRVQIQERHTRVVNAFSAAGYLALSHNTSSKDTDFAPDSLEQDVLGPRASGVIVVVSKNYASGWSDIVYDVSGRAIAANLDLTNGSTVRIVPTYGVTGSNSANFTSLYAKKIAEGLLNDFLTEQAVVCDNKGWHMIVAGDINSYQQPSIDHNGGPSMVRPECLSSHLLSLGFHDTFRQRFPTTSAFTHISLSGGSRLDQIWIRPALGLMLPIVSACIVWDWPFKSDHSPVAADFFNIIPQVYDQEERPPQPPWRLLLAEAEDNEKCAIINQKILIQIEPLKDLMESIRIKLCRVRQAANSPDKMDPVLARSIIESA